MTLQLIVNSSVVIVSGETRGSVESSSYFETKDNHVLLNHVFSSQLTGSYMTCAQICLTKPRCQSFNFEKLPGDVKGEGSDCEFSNVSLAVDSSTLIQRQGFVYGRLLRELEIERLVFTSLGAKGREGPVSVTGYKGTNLEERVQLDKGIQIWKVSSTGKYSILALGASGGNGTCVGSSGCSGWRKGGRGASIKGTFWLNSGTSLKILVGQKGFSNTNFPDRPGGGGGGTFVVLTEGLKPLVVAGGGGGGGIGLPLHKDGDPGQAGENGTREGGYAGKGGRTVNLELGSTFLAGSGAGFSGDGMPKNIGVVAKSFLHGGGGTNGVSDNSGFGGGGFGMTHAGGGGGFSGGGVIGNATAGAAGGGGSYNIGTSQVNLAGFNEGDGKVIIIHLN